MGAFLTPSCKAQCKEREGGGDQKQVGETASEDGWGWAEVTSWRQPGTGREGGGWCMSVQKRTYGHLGYGIGKGNFTLWLYKYNNKKATHRLATVDVLDGHLAEKEVHLVVFLERAHEVGVCTK